MDINAEVSTQLSLIHALLSDLDKSDPSCANKKNEKNKEETQDAMPDSTTNTEKATPSTFNCGDDVLVPNKDGRYYLGTIVELSSSNDNDSCEVGTGVAQCLVKFGDGTHAWAAVSALKLLSAPAADDGRIMCVVCKRRDADAVISCDMCGRGYHPHCHTPPAEKFIAGASWHCKRCVDQRYRVAAAENRALKRSSDLFRYKGNQQRRQQQELMPPCDTGSTTSSTTSDTSKGLIETHCYCNQKSDWLAQMLLCCRCSRWFHQRCVTSLQYPLYAGDKLYIFACATCNGGREYLRRLELSWVELVHLALYNLTAYNAPNYFDLDAVLMPYIQDNWHALQLPDKMWRTPVSDRRDHVLAALTSSRKRFKSGREMKKRATIWGLRLRRPPPPPACLTALAQIKKGEPLSDALVSEYASRLRFQPQVTSSDRSFQISNYNKTEKSSYSNQSQHMIVPVDSLWLNLMMGKRFHENLTSNSNSENDSTSSYESSTKAIPTPEPESPERDLTLKIPNVNVTIDKTPPIINEVMVNNDSPTSNASHSSRLANMNLELSKLSTKNIIEHSKIMSLQHMNSIHSPGLLEESSGDETSSRGTLDSIIPPLKDFQGKNNPFLMQNGNARSTSASHKYRPLHARHSFPAQPFPTVKRKLCEKDLVIGPNGEVKRRKYRRPKKNLLNKSCPTSSSTPTASVRRLRQRPARACTAPPADAAAPPPAAVVAPPPSTAGAALSLSPRKIAEGDAKALMSSVQSYFRTGRKLRVLAKRTPLASEHAQYLILWEPDTGP